jgi:hypothetical protein
MTASHADSFNLSINGTFQNRVQVSLISACVNISSEGWTVAFHRERASFCAQVLQSPALFVPLFSNAAATDANVLSDATAGGTIVLTSTNSSTAQAAVTDTHIDTAVASMFNAFIREPGS